MAEKMRFLNAQGVEISEVEFRAVFGPGVVVEPVVGATWTVIALKDSGNNVATVVEVVSLSGVPASRSRLAWPGDEAYSSEWKDEPGWPGPFSPLVINEYYDPRKQEPGPYTVDLADAVSERVSGLGMIAGTNHRHVQVWYINEAAPPPPPPPPPVEPPWVEQVRALLIEAQRLLDEALELLP